MCGIAGVIERKERTHPQREDLEKMGQMINHRGPDESGVFIKGPVGLVHQRLCIIDLKAGQQPMTNDRGDLCIVFNGEIYNFLELKAELEKKGYIFKRRSDTEVLLYSYQEWGQKCLDKLNGMFSFAIWDLKKMELFAARDRLGKKPFFYYIDDNKFLFASEMKAILSYPGVNREIDYCSLDEYFTYTYIPAPGTIFKDIKKLPQGHYLRVNDGKVDINSYWDFSFSTSIYTQDENEYLENLDEMFRESVRCRLISDVPLGAFLSGGVDSSAVVAIMSHFSNGPVKTFTIGFEEAGYSEIEDARLVAKQFGTDHNELIVKPSAVDILPDIVWHYDEPFGDSSSIPTYYVSKMAADKVKVVLSGDGGDELFAGYVRYLDIDKLKQYNWMPQQLRKRMLKPLVDLLPMNFPGRSFMHYLARYDFNIDLGPTNIFPCIKDKLYTQAFKRELSCKNHIIDSYVQKASSFDSLSRRQYIDIMHYLPNDILTKVDRASMAHSLEVRSPLLDHRLYEYLATIPSSLKLKEGNLKYIFKKLCTRYLPKEVLNKKKQGFAIPNDEWFRKELNVHASEILLDSKSTSRGYFRRQTLERILKDHKAERKDYSAWLWCLLVLEYWHQVFWDEGTRRV